MLSSARILVFSVLASMLGLSACQPKSDSKSDAESEKPQLSAQQNQPAIPSLEGEIVKLQLSLPECDGKSCPEISIERLQSNQAFIDQIIDQQILRQLEQMLDIAAPIAQTTPLEHAASEASTPAVSHATVANTTVPATPQQQLESQVQPYTTAFLQLDQEIKQLGATHAINLMIKPKILDAQGPMVTVVINSSSYLGGAHGAAAQQYYHFDLTQKKQLQLADILQDKQQAALKQQAYEVFKRWVIDAKLANSVEDYEQVWPFKLSNNFFLGQQGLILQYGEYEIGPYVVGLPRLVVPYAQLQSILKPQYLPQSDNKKQTKSAPAVEKTAP